MGKPFANGFAMVSMSGSMPSCSYAKNDPVRPSPH
jgi:hypothetical protein